MTDIILHHYPSSPFAEKIRAVLGSRKLTWKSVIIPAVMPKPDVVALTGGYRRTPILQLGADIYCDTALIARKLDELSSEPTLFPEDKAFAAQSIASWADSILFSIAVPLIFQPAVIARRFSSEEEATSFIADRAALGKNGRQRRVKLPEAKAVFESCLRDFNRQLETAGPFVLGKEVTIADFAAYNPFWFVRNAALVNESFKPYAAVQAWLDRIAAMGHGDSEAISSSEAIAIAANSQALAQPGSCNIDGIAPGDLVSVAPADYGIDPVQGKLLHADDREVVLIRRDERAGEVAVHFPRFCYSVEKCNDDNSQ